MDKLEVNAVRFNLALQHFADKMGFNGVDLQRFVKRQASLLFREVIRVTPPRGITRTKKLIAVRVLKKFVALENPKRTFEDSLSLRGDKYGAKRGRKDIVWYHWSHTDLRGVKREAAEFSKRATVDDLEKLFHYVSPKGVLHAGNRGKQKVLLWQKVSAKRAEVLKLIRRIQDRVGRLKAGWLLGWLKTGAEGGNVPEYVARNFQPGKSTVIDGLGIPGAPQFSVINRSAGVGHEKCIKYVFQACENRAQKMMKDLQLYLDGVKKDREVLLASTPDVWK